MPQPATQPFTTAAFNAKIAQDQRIRTLMLTAMGAGVLMSLVLTGTGAVLGVIAPAFVLGLWMWWSITTAKAARTLAGLSALLLTNPRQAEATIQQTLRYRPVLRWVRLLTYHRLAGLRHLQRRFDQSAAICLCLLNQPLKGAAAAIRSHLLLMLAEAQMQLGNLPGAYHALAHLQQTRLGLTESLQRLAIQTRYELAVGQYDAALRRSRAKVQLSELMPASHCAAMHAMLAFAARQADQPHLADWLWKRTQLLAPPKLFAQLQQGEFNVGVVEHESPTT